MRIASPALLALDAPAAALLELNDALVSLEEETVQFNELCTALDAYQRSHLAIARIFSEWILPTYTTALNEVQITRNLSSCYYINSTSAFAGA